MAVALRLAMLINRCQKLQTNNKGSDNLTATLLRSSLVVIWDDGKREHLGDDEPWTSYAPSASRFHAPFLCRNLSTTARRLARNITAGPVATMGAAARAAQRRARGGAFRLNATERGAKCDATSARSQD